MDSDMEDFLISMIRRNPTNPNDKPWEKKGQQTKNSALSVQARNKGNELFKKSGHNEKTHMAILLHYTKSIALAIENSEEQALGYGNRSALLMHLGKYKKCLIDVTRALKITQSSDLKKKLLLRKEKCSASIKEEEDKAKNSNNLDQPLFTSPQDLAFYKVFSQKHLSSKKALKNKDYKEKTTSLDTEGFSKLKVPKITKANKKIPCFSDSITIEYNRKYGRHVVATRDIKPGEILVVDKGIVYPRANKIYLACSHCLNFAWNAVPCPTCIFVIYCSDKCKMDAWQEYHDVECSILPPLIAETSLDEHMMLVISALRLFLKFVKDEGLDDMIDQVKSLKNDKNAIINGFFTDGQFDSTKFRSYYNLLNENGNLKEERNSPIGPVAVLLLTKYSTVLGDFDYFKLDEKHEQIVKMIVSLETLIAKYSYPFQSFFCNCTDVKECALECPKILGSITTPSLNLFNHACFENANKVFCKDGKIIIYSTRPIKKNEQVFINYGNDNTPDKKKRERQLSLKIRYNFDCTCEACENNWSEKLKVQWKPNRKIEKKINEEMKIFEEKILDKNLDYVTLAMVIKRMELAYQHFDTFNAMLYNNDEWLYMQKFIQKFYGIEIDMPNEC